MMQFKELDRATVRRTYEVLGGIFLMVFIAALMLALTVGILVSVPLGLATGFLAIAGAAIYGGWRFAMLLHDVQDNAYNAKLAVVAKLNAEAEAIRGAAQLNLNTGSGTQKVVNTNKPVTYTVNGKVVTGNQFIQVAQSEQPRKIEIPASDVLRIFEQLPIIGHTRNAWLGQKLPFSGITINYLIYKTVIIDPLLTERDPAIVGRGTRASGELVVTDPKALVKYVEQAYPGALKKGITLEIPAKTSGS